MIRRLAPAALVVALGCAPQNAELTEGAYKIYLSEGSSLTISQERVDLVDAEIAYNIDCRTLADERDRLEEPLDVCGNPAWPPAHEGWIGQDAYRVMGETLEPWRGEAIMTSEGDLQVGFHHRLTGGEDMRFAFVVDPVFQPQVCEQAGDGTELVDVDGDWIESWSSSEYTTMAGEDDSGSIFFLNARSYQFNPSELDEVWSIPLRWRAGFADARFGPEKFVMRSTRYGEPSFYTQFEEDDAIEPGRDDLFYTSMDEGADPSVDPDYQALCGRVEGIAEEVAAEHGLVVPDDEPEGFLDYQPAVHCNEWREPDGRPSGLDAWVELHYNWVRINENPANIAVGEPVSGEFHLVFDGEQTQSRLLVQGEFVVDRIKKDRWVTDDIQAIKTEEYGTVVCGE